MTGEAPGRRIGGVGNSHRHEDRPEVIVSMLVGALSGFTVGFLLRGEFLGAAGIFAAAFVAGCIGWWARGVA
jgi:hypothetical protein